MTIGFNHLGRHGRLGNQMFQYAGLRGIAAHKGYDFAIPPSDFTDEWTDHQLFEAFKQNQVKYKELSNTFLGRLLKTCFQSFEPEPFLIGKRTYLE